MQRLLCCCVFVFGWSGAAATRAAASEPGPLDRPCPVIEAVGEAVGDRRLGVFGPAVADNGTWGRVLISEVKAPDVTIQGLDIDDLGFSAGISSASFGVEGRYFYPASSIKLFAAIAAFEQIEGLSRLYGRPDANRVGRETPLSESTGMAVMPWSAPVLGSNPLLVSRAGDMRLDQAAHEALVVSDNRAYNLLYDFLGQDDLALRMQAWGAWDSWVVHRLALGESEFDGRRAPRILIRAPGGQQIQIGERFSEISDRCLAGMKPTQEHRTPTEGYVVGSGYIADGMVVEGSFDFSGKNYASLEDLQSVLCQLVRPDVRIHLGCTGDQPVLATTVLRMPVDSSLDLTDSQRAKLVRSATMRPRESRLPRYDPEQYPDDYVKFLLPGLIKVRPQEEWRVVNKIGLAYGFVTENAYVEHLPTGNAVFVAAVIHRNPNGIYNDGIYDYDTTLAEMATLGEVVGRALVADD
ncbi:MAG: serine hydrolase [Planctomycetota bacterium]